MLFSLPDDHACLPGHFPGRPLVPGVVLLEQVLRAIEAQTGVPAGRLRLPQVKFMAPLLPGQTARVELEGQAPRWKFRVLRDAELLVRGELVLDVDDAPGMNDADWKQRPEGGGRSAIRLIAGIARHGGRGIARICLYPITAYFFCVRGSERRASRDYLRRVLGRRVGALDVARHIHTFAATILDRVFLLAGRMNLFDIQPRGTEQLLTLLDQGRGVLIFGSHLGSFDALRALARQRPGLKLRVLLDRSHNAAITDLLAELDPTLAAGIIDAGQDGPSIVLAIQQALEEGAMVSLLVDRVRPGDATLAAPLLGAAAPFPTAPWLLAGVLKAPVMLAFGLYRGRNRYDLLFEPFEDCVDIPRARRAEVLSALIHRYAGRLEHHLRSAPYNWFNFYDFWHSEDSGSTPPPAVRDVARDRQHGESGAGQRR